MPVDSFGEMERTPVQSPVEARAPECLRVRCPDCRKLYLVQFADIQEAKPRFECVQCRARFWLSLADMDLNGEIIGLPVQQREPIKVKAPERKLKRETEPCPKCFRTNDVGAHECRHCGVVIEKYKTALDFEGRPKASPSLDALWKRVVADYGNESAHQDFMRACQKERNLPFAAAQYGQMKSLMPADETTARRLSELNALAVTMLPPVKKPALAARLPFSRLWQIPFLFSAVFIIVGVVYPMFRNLAGLGAALFFAASILYLQFGRR